MSAIDDVAAERQRQIEKEGWDAEHDDEHTEGSLALAGACYAANAADSIRGRSEGIPRHQQIGWPWEYQAWKPKHPRRDLVRAAALIVAELDRMDRLNPKRTTLNPQAAWQFPSGHDR